MEYFCGGLSCGEYELHCPGGGHNQDWRYRAHAVHAGRGPLERCAVMAAEEINAKGGVQVGDKKLPIELVKVDSNEFVSLPDATNAAELAISRHKVNFLVGGFRTEAVLVMQDIAMDNKVDLHRLRGRSSQTL